MAGSNSLCCFITGDSLLPSPIYTLPNPHSVWISTNQAAGSSSTAY